MTTVDELPERRGHEEVERALRMQEGSILAREVLHLRAELAQARASRTVHAVTGGEYDEWRVIALYVDEADARRAADRLNDEVRRWPTANEVGGPDDVYDDHDGVPAHLDANVRPYELRAAGDDALRHRPRFDSYVEVHLDGSLGSRWDYWHRAEPLLADVEPTVTVTERKRGGPEIDRYVITGTAPTSTQSRRLADERAEAIAAELRAGDVS